LAYLVRLCVLAYGLNIHWTRHFWVNVNVVAATHAIKPETQFLQQTLQVPKGNSASAPFHGL
jgi:hypothetical protein